MNIEELWQLYDEQGNPINGKGATRDEIFGKGILHGASHVWIWRKAQNAKEILVQKRAATKRTWPNLLDISAAGHIDLGETPLQAAIRETNEEIGLKVSEQDLQLVGINRIHLSDGDGNTENEFRWIYTLELKNPGEFNLQSSEVQSTQWMELQEFKQSVLPNNGSFVPQGDDYFKLLISSLE